MADWEVVEEGSVIRGLYRPLDISLREIDCSC